MKEIHDPNGAILFKEDEGDPLDKRVKILETKVANLTEEVSLLKDALSKLTKL